MKKSLHTHTTFSDGKNTPREMIEAAIKLGMDEIGITDHSYTFFDESYCMPLNEITTYRAEVTRLAKEYRDRITVRVGIEQDYYSLATTEGYDYAIGSVHYVKVPAGAPGTEQEPMEGILKDENGDVYIPVDESVDLAEKILKTAAEVYFNGDPIALAEEYFRTLGDVVTQTDADIIGHFDVLTKCNEIHPVFDTEDPRYKAAWKKAADELLETGKLFEINLSPRLRGIKKEPYPSLEILSYLQEKGGNFVFTGDCHSIEELKVFCEK